MADKDEKVVITAELPQSLLDKLVELANKRGVSANTVLQQAIEAEKFLDDKTESGSKILVEDAGKVIRQVIVKR